jgi:3-hydroxyisobutyrate dehydrogenase-like beta-hydroxyacid dehydrogenase
MSTVGILFPGELGTALATLLKARGHRLVTTAAGRSARTRQAARRAGFRLLPSLREVAGESDIVISLVPPRAALPVARAFARAAAARPLYVDANSVSPVTAAKIEKALKARGIPFVDAAIHGLASRLGTDGVLYLSGMRAEEVARLFGRSIPIRRLGRKAGGASALKMLTGGLNKGLAALYFELQDAASRAGLAVPLVEAYRDQYPGIMAVVDRITPSYAKHAARRADELRELERAMKHWGLSAEVIHGARRRISAWSRARRATAR